MPDMAFYFTNYFQLEINY